MWPGPRPTCLPSFVLIRPTVWPQCTNVTDKTDRQTDRQRTDSIGRTVLQTVAQRSLIWLPFFRLIPPMDGFPTSYHRKWYIAKTRCFGLHFLRRKFRSIFNPFYTFTQSVPKATKFVEITQNNGHYAVQGHSRSPILIPFKSSYATSY